MEPITAVYVREKDDWTVTVTGLGKELTGRAPGIIAARDRADQLVEKLTEGQQRQRTVVHLLNGSALEFTTAYMTARLTRTTPEDAEDETDATAETSDGTKDEPGTDAGLEAKLGAGKRIEPPATADRQPTPS